MRWRWRNRVGVVIDWRVGIGSRLGIDSGGSSRVQGVGSGTNVGVGDGRVGGRVQGREECCSSRIKNTGVSI